MGIVESVIPKGDYCYDGDYVCPYYRTIKERHYQENGWCNYLGIGDYEQNRSPNVLYRNEKTGDEQTAFELGMPLSLLWDMCKECDINEYTEAELNALYEGWAVIGNDKPHSTDR